MTRIGLLSDTHSYWDDRYAEYFSECDEIWHAGDICSVSLAEKLNEIAPLQAVCGNCDGGDLRRMYPEILRFKCEDADVLIKHIGGYPGHYDRSIAARPFHIGPFAYLEDTIRSYALLPAYQSGCGRHSGLAAGAHACSLHGRGQAL